MKVESKFIEGKRVRHANAADTHETPNSFPSPNTDLEKMNGNDLRGLRHQVEQGIGNGTVADRDVQTYFRFMDKVDAAIEKRNQRDAELKRRAVSAPAINTRGLGDSHTSLSENFSISRAINNAALGRQQDGAEAEVIAEGQNANPHGRGITLPSFVFKRNVYGNDAASGSVAASVTGKQTLSTQLLTALHDQPVAQALGATMVQASGTSFLVPFLGSLIPSTTDEGAALTSSASFSELTLSPNRYGRRVDITQLALRVANTEMDSIIMRSMAEGHATAKDRAAFAAVVANATFTAATAGSTADDLAVTDLEDIFNLAKDASTNSGRSQAPNIVCSPIGFKALNVAADSTINQTIAGAYRSATGAQVFQANTLQDGNITSANAVGGTGTIAGAGVAIAGNFGDLIVAEWGVDLVVDNVTNAESGIIRCISNSYVDAGVVRDSLRVMAVTATEIAAT
jgi:HK97 family phage major capsid protein